MRIGELSRASGIAASRIRFYETAGLIAPASRTPAGYRLYDDDALQVLRIIEQAQLGGFTLAEIKSLLPQPGPDGWNRTELLAALQRKATAIDELQQRLAESRLRIQQVIADIEDKPDDRDCVGNAEHILARLPPARSAGTLPA